MPSSSSPEIFPQKSLKIKQDDKFFSRLLSKENSAANPSFRVYYGNVSGSVPFTWEIQPGTPKHKFSDNSIPPLTPPPSYYISNLDDHDQINTPTKRKYLQRSKLIYKLLLNMNLIKKGHVASSSSPSSLSSSSWSSSLSSTFHSSKGSGSKRRRCTSFGSSFDDRHTYSTAGGSPDSVKCFGMNINNNDKNNRDSNNGSYTTVIMKKAFLSIVGRRSG